MLHLRLEGAGGRPPRVLCIGAHCDDIEIGCGATLLWLRKRWPQIEASWRADLAKYRERRRPFLLYPE